MTGKHLYQRVFSNKIAGLKLQPQCKKRLPGTGVFLWILRDLATFFTEHLPWLHLISVMPCDEIDPFIDHWSVLISFCFSSSLSMWFLVFYSEYRCIIQFSISLANCLKIGEVFRPKHRDIKKIEALFLKMHIFLGCDIFLT